MGCTQSAPGQVCSCLPNSHLARKAACAAGPSSSLKKRVAAGGLFGRRASQQMNGEDGDPAATMILKKGQAETQVPLLDGADGTAEVGRAELPEQETGDQASPRRSLRQSIGAKLNNRKFPFRNFLRSSGSGDTVSSSQDPGTPRETKGVCDPACSEASGSGGNRNNSACMEEASAFFKAFNSTSRTALTAQSEERSSCGNDGSSTGAEPTTEEMRAVWCVMKASCADRVEQKIEWLHRLEWLLVRLNPMESNHPTRHALLEARVLELCLGCLRDNQDDAGLCVSALAILVHMSLNDETSKKLASSHGLEDIAILLKKYYRRCQEREPAQPQAAQSGCPEQGETSDGSDPKGSSSPAGDSDATGASAKGLAPAQNTEVGAAGGPKEEREQASDDNKKSDSAGASMTENLQTDEGQLLAVELVTLVWRLIFATSLDGDEYAQKWIKAGAAEPAIDSVASDLDVFCSATYVCWVFGALRFLPLDNAELCEDFVRRRQLFQWTLKKMEMHHEEPLVLENGFAVLANYQRAQPAHAEILSKLPDVWTKCLSWLNTDKMMRVPDVVYQGLYTVGLACSYCPEACANLRDAKGIEFADKVVEAYGENMNSEVSSASSAWTEGTGGSSNDKYANVLQFAEGLRRLLQPVPLSAADIAAICQEPIQEADEEDSDEEKRNASRELDQGPRSEATAVKSDACHQDPAAAQDCVGPQSPTSPTPVETVENTECVVDRLTDGNTEHNIQSTKSSEMIPLPILTLRTRSVTHDSDGMSAEKVTPELLSLPVSEAGQGTPEGTLPALTPDEGQSPARASPGLTSFANAKATPIVSVEQLPAMSDAGQLMEKDVASCSMPAGSVLGAAPPSEAETTGDLTSPELSCASPDPAVEMPEQQPQATAAL